MSSPMTGTGVRRVRRQLGLTQREFGERVGVAAMTVSRWERGVLAVGSTAAILIQLLGELNLRQEGKSK